MSEGLLTDLTCIHCGRSPTLDLKEESIYCRKGCFTYSFKKEETPQSLHQAIDNACKKLGM